MFIVVDEPVLVFSELLRTRIETNKFNERASNSRWEELLGLVEHSPVFDEVFRETRRGGVRGGFLHSSVHFPRDQPSAVDWSLAFWEFLLEHLCNTKSTKFRDTVWSVVWKACAHGCDSGEEKDAIFLGILLAKEANKCLGEVERTIHVDVHGTLPTLWGKVHHHLARGVDACVVDKSAKRLAGLPYCFGDSLAALRVTDVPLDTDEFTLEVLG
mmetsp:Transcript_28271/g.68816  ORF Transcript_28271/g.68816 Transcript_28271/m.68816 type:complete len:214 (-) Transcript_28271:281-922(-)